MAAGRSGSRPPPTSCGPSSSAPADFPRPRTPRISLCSVCVPSGPRCMLHLAARVRTRRRSSSRLKLRMFELPGGEKWKARYLLNVSSQWEIGADEVVESEQSQPVSQPNSSTPSHVLPQTPTAPCAPSTLLSNVGTAQSCATDRTLSTPRADKTLRTSATATSPRRLLTHTSLQHPSNPLSHEGRLLNSGGVLCLFSRHAKGDFQSLASFIALCLFSRQQKGSYAYLQFLDKG